MLHDDDDSLIAGSLRRLKRIISAKPEYIAAHAHSLSHRNELESSDLCGCFYCLRIYIPNEIVEWIDEDATGIGRTALCPNCGIDSVIGSASGFPITEEFLKKMRDHWFQTRE